MAQMRPLVFAAEGFPQVLDAADLLEVGGPAGGFRHAGGALGFFGVAGFTAPPRIGGDFIDSLDQLIRALGGEGLILDQRLADWPLKVAGFRQFQAVGPYSTGRLIVGSSGGWTALDLPADQPDVLQVPARVNGRLAYAPVISRGPSAPLRPANGSLWFDTSTPGRVRIRIRSGGAWVDALPDALGGMAQAGHPGNQGLLVGGAGTAWMPLAAGARGESLIIDGSGNLDWEPIVYVGVAPPWPDGTSGRATRNGAIWADPSANAEALGFWDDNTRQWKRGYVNAPVLDRLAELRDQYLDGDLLVYGGGQMQRLPAGAEGQSLRLRAGMPKWESFLTVGANAPAAPTPGTLWVDSRVSRLKAWDGWAWVSLEADVWSDANVSGQALRPGQAVYLETGYKLADGRAVSERHFGGLVVAPAAVGAQVSVAFGGILTLTTAEWDGAIDPADVRARAGLNPGSDYWISSTTPGAITTSPASGAPIGTALDDTSLYLLPAEWGASRSSGGRWLSASVSPTLASRIQSGDLLAWNGTQLDRATVINGNQIALVLRTSSQLVDPLNGAVVAPGTAGAVAAWPTTSRLRSGPPLLIDGEMQLGTSPQDPAIFWRLSDGSTARLSRQDMARTYDLGALDLASDPAAAQVALTGSDGSTQQVVLRGADGIEVTCSNAGTLVISGAALVASFNKDIDGGRFSPLGVALIPGPPVIDAGKFTP
jgi:hypothetical protein